jgi:hypothetical protein
MTLNALQRLDASNSPFITQLTRHVDQHAADGDGAAAALCLAIAQGEEKT